MLAALALAAALPLGAWPETTGPAATIVDDVEFYLVEPEDDFSIVAVLPLSPPVAKADPAAIKRLARLAVRLGVDAVVLLGETREEAIPDDVDQPLPTSGRYAAAVFVVFDPGADGAQRAPMPARQADRAAPGGVSVGGR